MAMHLCQRGDIARRDDAGGYELLKALGNKLAKRVSVARPVLNHCAVSRVVAKLSGFMLQHHGA